MELVQFCSLRPHRRLLKCDILYEAKYPCELRARRAYLDKINKLFVIYFSISEVLQAYSDRISSLNEAVARIDEEEKEEKAARQAQDALTQVENQLNNRPDEREGRVWFQTKKETAEEKSKFRSTFDINYDL